jgi:hypothetical protein
MQQQSISGERWVVPPTGAKQRGRARGTHWHMSMRGVAVALAGGYPACQTPAPCLISYRSAALSLSASARVRTGVPLRLAVLAVWGKPFSWRLGLGRRRAPPRLHFMRGRRWDSCTVQGMAVEGMARRAAVGQAAGHAAACGWAGEARRSLPGETQPPLHHSSPCMTAAPWPGAPTPTGSAL